MKSLTIRQQHHNSLHRLIQDATSASPKDFAQIENIMREDVFHSTLDWQSREQLTAAARQAFDCLNQNRELYDLDRACRTAMFQKMRAESALCENDMPANRKKVADTESRHRTARKNLFALLDETGAN